MLTNNHPLVAILSSDLRLRRSFALEASRFARVHSACSGDDSSSSTKAELSAAVVVVEHSEQMRGYVDTWGPDEFVSMLVVAMNPCASVINEAHDLGWRLLCQPLELECFGRALQAILAASQHRDRRLAAALEDMAIRWGLTARQTEVLSLALRGERPRQMADQLGVARSTCRTHSRSLLLKSGTSSLALAAHRVLLRALEMPLPE